MEEMNGIATMTKNVKEKHLDLDLSNAHSTMCVLNARRGNALAHRDATKPFQIRIVRKFK
jgi:hypothetical protein